MKKQAGQNQNDNEEKRRAEGEERVSRGGLRTQIFVNAGLSAVITLILEVLLVSNLAAFADFLYQTGNDSPAVTRFAFGSTITVLLFTVLGILVFTLIFLLLEQRTIHDIENIARAVRHIAEGEEEEELEVSGENELSEIADAVNRMETDIQGLLKKERDSEQSKRDLITNVAHDLRTPLTSILGYIDLLRTRNDIDPDTRKHYLDIVSNKAERLQTLINELFGFTKLSYGKPALQVRSFDIVELLAQLLEESYPNFEKHHLSYDFKSNVPALSMTADPDLLARLFDNLINNAIKYGKDGKYVRVRLTAGREIVTVRVVNYGYVIPENELPLIFDKFYRVERSRASSTGGTGLGLAIVKNITEMHHGDVKVTSDFSGTSFTVRLPINYKEDAR